jgi:hypothetical protein
VNVWFGKKRTAKPESHVPAKGPPQSMSTYFVADVPIAFHALQSFTHEGVTAETADQNDAVVLTDGQNHLWATRNTSLDAYVEEDRQMVRADSTTYRGVLFIRYGANRPENIIAAIERFFGAKLIPESDPRFEKIIKSDSL